jgi:hypothetical protein
VDVIWSGGSLTAGLGVCYIGRLLPTHALREPFMRSRPISVTIIGWFLLASGVLTLPGAFAPTDNPEVQELMARRPVPIVVQQVMLFAGAVANLVSGYFLLRGQNWARHLYIAWTIVQFGYAWLAAPFRLVIVPGVLFFLLVAFFLFRPRANAFFAGSELVDVVAGEIAPRRVVGIGGYVLAGVFLTTTCFAAFINQPWAEKSGAILVMLVPVLACLAIGRIASGSAYSANGRWLRDLGVVFVATAAASAFMVVSLAMLMMDAEFQKLMPPMPLDDYWSGLAWIAVTAAIGGAALYAGRERR